MNDTMLVYLNSEIHRLTEEGWDDHSIADHLGVTTDFVKFSRRRVLTFVPKNIPVTKVEKTNRYLFTEEDKEKIREMDRSGQYGRYKIAKLFGCTYSAIRHLLGG